MSQRRLPPGASPARDRWSFADDETARADQAPARPTSPQGSLAQASPPPQAPAPLLTTERDFLFVPSSDAAMPIPPPANAPPPSWPLPPAAAIPLPSRKAPRPPVVRSPSPTPSHWARIEVPEADRARAAAAGVERYMDDSPRSRRSRPASWLALAAILLVAGSAAVALYRFADPLAGPQDPAVPRAAERATPPAGFEPLAPTPRQPPPSQPTPSQAPAARDTPLIEVAP
ncbi:MAG: hypothetical protein ACK4NA_13945 [Alphaproteobacteria bacterium]